MIVRVHSSRPSAQILALFATAVLLASSVGCSTDTGSTAETKVDSGSTTDVADVAIEDSTASTDAASDDTTTDTTPATTCTKDADCAAAEVFWNDLTTLKAAGAKLDLQVNDTASSFGFPIPLAIDGKSATVQVKASFLDGTGSKSAQSIRYFTPPSTKDGSFTSTLMDLVFGWKGDMPYLDLLFSKAVAVTLRLDFAAAATTHCDECQYVLGVAGTGPEGPTSITSDVEMTDFGTFDAFATGASLTLKDSKTLVATGGKVDGYRFVLLAKDAKAVELAITSGGADAHGYIVGVARIRKRKCDKGSCVADVPFVCGNGTLEPGESCDDGGTKPGDGCDAGCLVEDGFTCTEDGKLSVCKASSTCGDGVLEGAEECDDKNTTDDDGCNKGCKVEAGYVCSSAVDINTGSDGKGKQATVGTNDIRWESASGADWGADGSAGDAKALEKTPALPPTSLTWKPAGVVQKCVPSWHTVDGAQAAQWISTDGWDSAKNACKDVQVCTAGRLYYYRVKFNLSSAAAAADMTLQGTLWADNQITRIWINGKKVTQYKDPAPNTSNFVDGSEIAFSGWTGYFVAGANEIVVAVANFTSPACPNPQGLVFAVDLSKASVCTKKASCGNGTCDDGETETTCPADCKAVTNSCVGKCGQFDPDGTCQCDTACTGSGDCCADYAAICGGGGGGSCVGKCGKFDSSASCQCDTSCAGSGDCCADYTKECGSTCTPACTGKSCGDDGCGGSCGTCDDANGCTADSCNADGTCGHVACSTGAVFWNNLSTLSTAPSTATEATPYTFKITGWDQAISMYRSGNTNGVKSYTAPSTNNGSFDSAIIPNLKFAWTGTFPYIDILTQSYANGGPKVEGIVSFNFGAAAKTRGPSWRYVLVIGGLAGPGNEGPTTVTCDQPMSPIGTFDAFATGQSSVFTAPSTLATGPSGKTEGLSFFTLPGDTTKVNCTIKSLGGTMPDQHGYAVGMVDMNVSQCSGTGATAKCAGNTCGDGLLLGDEACDDGNTAAGDGCADCKVEANWACTGALKSSCKKTAVCGNAVLEADEECDDLNVKDGDGCSKDCKIEEDYECTSTVDLNTGSTGAGKQAANGSTDLQWEVALGANWPNTTNDGNAKVIDNTPATPPAGLTWKAANVVEKCVGSWHTVDPSKAAQWIAYEGWDGAKNVCVNPADCLSGQMYYYRVDFNLANEATALSTSLQGKLWADNLITRIWINGKAVTQYTPPQPMASSFTGEGIDFAGWKGYYKAGLNELVVAVANYSNNACPNPEGLALAVDLAKGSVCAKKCGAFGQPCCATTGGASACEGVFQCDSASSTCKCATGGAVCGGACCNAGEFCKEGKCADPAAEKCLEIFLPAATVLNPACETSNNCPISCKAELAVNPAAKSGIYLIKPDPAKPAFQAQCDMLIDGGGWTLVGYEPAGAPSPANGTGVMAQMAKESAAVDTTKLAQATAAGYIGPRFGFKSHYSEARLTWCTAALAYRYQKFTTSADLFANTMSNKPVTATAAADEMVRLSNFSSNDAALNLQLANPNDAAFCRAYAGAKIPGDTSWGVKQKDESSNNCGCNSGGWTGTGSYYGGKGGGGNNDGCGSQGGGWAGTAGNGVKKGGINTNTTFFWIR